MKLNWLFLDWIDVFISYFITFLWPSGLISFKGGLICKSFLMIFSETIEFGRQDFVSFSESFWEVFL